MLIVQHISSSFINVFQEIVGKLALAEKEKRCALKSQKNYYEQLASRIKMTRDKFEAEQKAQLINKMLKEKEDALEKQWQLSEK